MIEDWMDALCNVWVTVDAPGFRTVRSPLMIKKSEFPASVDPSNDFPIAISVPESVEIIYSIGGPKIGWYEGVTEFHITPDLSMAHMPALLPWYGAIWKAAAANMQLGGLVESFTIKQQPEKGIVGPLGLQRGSEAEHWGFLVSWIVKEKDNAAITVGS